VPCGQTRRHGWSNSRWQLCWFSVACWLTGGCDFLAPPPTPTDLPTDCAQITNLFSVQDLLDVAGHPCRDWVDGVYGRVARSSFASATIYTRNTSFGTGVLLSAVHTLGVGWFGPASTDIPAMVHHPIDETGVARLFLIEENGSALSTLASPLFNLYNPALSAETNRDQFRDIPPREDFYFGVVDAQKLPTSPFLESPDPLQDQPLPLYDPNGVTTSTNAIAEAAPGQLALLVGFPAEGLLRGEPAASVARILDDEAAIDAVDQLADAMDEEGDIPYDAEAELLLIGEAIPGMSGGGAFDSNGRLLGIIVRASEPIEGRQYIRAVRATFAVSQLESAINELPAEVSEAVAPYLDQSLLSTETPPLTVLRSQRLRP